MKFLNTFLVGLGVGIAWGPIFAAEETFGVIAGVYANVRSKPNASDSVVVHRATQGTALKILEKAPESIKIENLEGHWAKVYLIEEKLEGWVFDQYIAAEKSPFPNEYIRKILGGLYYYRSELTDQVEQIKKQVSLKNALTELRRYDTRFLNYIGYYLLSEKNLLAIPAFIVFLDPVYEKENKKDANYFFTWELLQRLTPSVLITNNFESYKFWWERYHDRIHLELPAYEFVTIFKKIKKNETNAYRSLAPS